MRASSSGSGTTSSRPRPRSRRRGCSRSSSTSSGRLIALGIDSGVRLMGREPGEDEIEPLSRTLLERARATPSISYMGAIAQLQALARGLVAFWADYDVLMTPALGERPLAIGECDGMGDEPLADSPAPASSRRTRRSSTSPASPRSRCPSGSAPTACPPACRSSASRSTRSCCCSSRHSWRRRTRGRT